MTVNFQPVVTADEARSLSRKTVRYYDDHAEDWAATESPLWVDSRMLAFRSLLGLDPLIFDIGCGSGRVVSILKAVGIQRIIGVDPSVGLLGIARKRHPDMDFRLGRMQDLPRVVHEKCDGFFCGAVLEHVPRDELVRALENLRHANKDGAVGHIITPHGNATIVLTHENAEHIPQGYSVLVEMYDQDELKAQLKSAGFEVIRELTFNDTVMFNITVQAV